MLFTKQQTKRTTVPEEMTFYLLHLSLFREYLGYEFSDLQKTLPFPFDLERIIDDWVGGMCARWDVDRRDRNPVSS